jgi:membrane associated rhomboid family serine protease
VGSNQFTNKRLIFALIVSLTITLAAWNIMEGASPLLGHSGWVARLVTFLSFPAIIVSIVISRNPHAPPIALNCLFVFVIWFVASYVSSALIFRRS